MSTGSFAEILREKIKKTDKKASVSPANDDISSINIRSQDNLQLNQLRQRLFEQMPNTFHVSQSRMTETPYRRFQKQHSNETKEWAKKVQSQVTSSSVQAKPTPRPKGVPHKLNEKQTLAMTYFVNEKMFLLEDFTAEELKKAYRKLALNKHPDRQSGSPQAFLELKKQYECLSTVFKK